MKHRPADLVRRYQGAPESLARALRAAIDTAPSRLDRRELTRRLAAIEDAPSPSIPGVASFPAVWPGGDDGCVYRIIVTDGPRHDLARPPRAQVDRVSSWLAETWPDLDIEGAHVQLSGPPPGERWSGRSCELALVAALVSWSLGLPTRTDRVSTGCVGAPGRIADVAHVPEKQQLVGRDLGADAVLVHPSAIDHDAARALDDLLGSTWRTAYGTRAERTASRRARDARQAYQARRYKEAARLAEAVLSPVHDVAARARATWVLGAIALHDGRAQQGLEYLAEALQLVDAWEEHDDAPPEDLTAEEMTAHLVVGLLDAGQVRAAWQLGQRTLAHLGEPRRRTARWRFVMLQLAGSTHRAAVALDAHDDAAELLAHYNLGRAALDHQRARALGDLAEVHRKAGRLHEGRTWLHHARRALRDTRDHERAATERFLHLYAARAGLETPDPHAPTLWPGLGLRLQGALRSPTPQADLTRLVHQPAVRQSAALRWVCVSACAHVSGTEALIESLCTDWTVDDAALTDLITRARAGDLDAARALARRCPY